MNRTLLSRVALSALMTAMSPLTLHSADPPGHDLSKEKVLYCVGYSHLDTQWRWDFTTTINQYLRDTLEQNFSRFEAFPGYVFNFTGADRYAMIKEYYPDQYEKVKKYIADGRWFVSGSSVDEGDVNVPCPESIVRQVLYGNEFFRREFGKESVDYMLPDCFGFPASLPSILAHCGLRGFSTQKLVWGSAVGIPFKIGVWEGPDGRSVIAAFDPGAYDGAIQGRVDLNKEWTRRVLENGQRYGVWADYHYYGVGDQGGAPKEEDVRNYVASADQPDSPIKIVLSSSDQMYKDITEEQKARLPRYRGDLLLTQHSAGSLTSQAYMKRWNRKNEIIADAAERAAVASWWLGAADYPREKLTRSWMRFLGDQMHDILPGTTLPRCSQYSWNDEIVATNGFAAVLTNSVGAVTRALDTRAQGIPLIVYNALAIEREDVVEAEVRFAEDAPQFVAVFDPNKRPVPSQVISRNGQSVRVLFRASVPSLSWSVFDVRPSDHPQTDDGVLRISETRLENESYRVTIDNNGDVSSVIDKAAGDRELLASPARLAFTHEKPKDWPAWNMDWSDRNKPPIDFVAGPPKVRILERGPVRIALEIEREARDSIIRQNVRLASGNPGRRLEFATEIDWQSAECALKASFPLSPSNPKATYNWGLGTVERGNNEPTKYEVPSHEWLDLTDSSGEYGVSVLEDCKYGSDKPSDNELRLTLLYTPGVHHSYLDQHSQDWGRHEMVYALYGHMGDWRAAGSEWQGRRLNQPLRAWQATAHEGPLGSSFGLLKTNSTQIDVRAVKLAEESDRIIIRLQELSGREAKDVTVSLGGAILDAEEVDGQERRIANTSLNNGNLVVNFSPFALRSFSLHLASPASKLKGPRNQPLSIPYDTDVISHDGSPGDGHFDTEGRSIPAELLPAAIVSEGIEFRLGPTADGAPNALSCHGQTLDLPASDANRLYLLAAADEDLTGRFTFGDRTLDISIQSWAGFVGQWDTRIWDHPFGEVDHICDGKVVRIKPGYIKRDPIAWFGTHIHHPSRGNEAYQFSYLFIYGLDVRPGERTLRLPDEPRIKILAVTAARNDNDAVRPAAPLYDDFSGRRTIDFRHLYPPPPVPVFEGVAAVARAETDRQMRYEDLRMGPPSAGDYADQASGRGITFRYFDGDGESRPHPRSGVKGDALPRLNDGEAARNDDDTDRCVWYDGEGRFYVDLKQSVRLKRINTYSWHRDNRAPQNYSLWGSNAATMPNPGFQHGNHGDWSLLAVVDTKSLGDGGVHGSSVVPQADQSSMGPFRHLLWITQDVGQGTFFTEIDVLAAE